MAISNLIVVGYWRQHIRLQIRKLSQDRTWNERITSNLYDGQA
jgi:hypothetical protein